VGKVCAITGKKRVFGNNRPFSEKKTRRSWKPNVQKRRMFVPELGRTVRVQLSTRALRTIEKKGGLMPYLQSEGIRLEDVTC
jgi:large subunit ribosomal protein L28